MWAFQPDELERYLDILAQHMVDFEEGSDLREMARDELARGDDGVLKALLMLLCPRLRTVYYARSSYVSVEDEKAVGNTSLEWLCRIILSHRDQDIGTWPPGLQSLRHLAVGVETGTQFDSDLYHLCYPLLFAKIMNLPNLESFYLYGLGRHEQQDYDASDPNEVMSYPLTPGCSSVRHIYLEDLQDFDSDSWGDILSACKSQVCKVRILTRTISTDFRGLNSSPASHLLTARLTTPMPSLVLQ